MANDGHNDNSKNDFSRLYSDLFGQNLNKPGTRISEQNGNIIIDLTITLEEAATGKLEIVQYSRQEKCEICEGTGQSWRTDEGICENCASKGCIEQRKTKKVSIPTGIETGANLRIPGEGNLKPKVLIYGDLYLAIKIDEHKLFERRGKNLYTNAAAAQNQLRDGAEIIVPTLLDGRKRLRIPPGTINGAAFRLAGLGVRSIDSGERGDLFVKVTTGNADRRAGVKSEASKSSFKPDCDNPGSPFKNFFGSFSPSIFKTKGYSFKNHKKPIFITVIIVITLVIIPIIFSFYKTNRPLESNKQNTNIQPAVKISASPFAAVPQSSPTPERTPVSLPNGSEIIPIQGPRGNNTLKIINGGNSDVAVKIVNSSTGKTRRFVYVRANSTAVFKSIARELCVLRITSGSDWDNDTRKFLSNRSFYEFDKPFDFRKIRYTLSLTPTPDGNLRDVPLSEEDFEDK